MMYLHGEPGGRNRFQEGEAPDRVLGQVLRSFAARAEVDRSGISGIATVRPCHRWRSRQHPRVSWKPLQSSRASAPAAPKPRALPHQVRALATRGQQDQHVSLTCMRSHLSFECLLVTRSRSRSPSRPSCPRAAEWPRTEVGHHRTCPPVPRVTEAATVPWTPASGAGRAERVNTGLAATRSRRHARRSALRHPSTRALAGDRWYFARRRG